MRKPRDYETELKALGDKTKLLKERKVRQLGELVIATGADVLDPEILMARCSPSPPRRTPRRRRRGASAARGTFGKDGRGKPIATLKATARAIRRTRALQHRLETSRRRDSTKAWIMQRRERTRHLIELGGLVQKAGLVELTGDDRAILLGAFLSIADMLSGEDRADALALWQRRGMRAFDKAARAAGTKE